MLRRWAPLIVLVALLALFFGLHLDRFLSFTSLRDHRAFLLTWTAQHYTLASFLFFAGYTLAVVISIPGALFFTLTGGFLFGIIWGTCLVVISATLGATLLFLAVQMAIGNSLAKRASRWSTGMRLGFQNNAFSYLLMLRLIPLFPFWVVNIVPALLKVNLKTYVSATLIGIIPGSLVYVTVGNGLSQVFAHHQTPNLNMIFSPSLLFPMLALAALCLVPVLYQQVTRKSKRLDPHTFAYDLAIIGGGVGGLSLASGCGQLGLNVVIVESGKMGGDCLNTGCIPSKSLLAAAKTFYQSTHSEQLGLCVEKIHLDFSKVMQHVHRVIAHIAPHDSIERFESLGVQVIKGSGQFINPGLFKVNNTTIKAKRFVIATGSSPFIPPIPGLDSLSYFTNETIFELTTQPQHLIVIGGGPIGCELAQAFAMLGSQVTILEALTILPKDDSDCVSIVRNTLLAMNITVYEQTKIHQFKQSSAGITVNIEQKGRLFSLLGTHVLVATGRRPNVHELALEKAGVDYSAQGIKVNAKLQSSNKNIYAIGDVVGPYPFTHMANYQAGIVLRNTVFKWPAKINYTAVPWVTYTEPELAHVGMSTEETLKPTGGQITEWLFTDNDRAQTEGNTNGKIRVLTDKKARILGVTIVGNHAGELILPWIMAIREGKTLRVFTDTIVPYPTLSEINKQVAGAFYKPKLFSSSVRAVVAWLRFF